MDKVVYIHCAEGFGRTGMLAVMVIRSGGEAQSLEEAIKAARGKRPGIRFNKTQMAALKSGGGGVGEHLNVTKSPPWPKSAVIPSRSAYDEGRFSTCTATHTDVRVSR